MHATSIDIDLRCVHMTYLQASLLHIPAIVLHGNSISGEGWDRWYTPAHVLGGWSRRLEACRHAKAAPTGEAEQEMTKSMSSPAMPPSAAGAALREQMRLF